MSNHNDAFETDIPCNIDVEVLEIETIELADIQHDSHIPGDYILEHLPFDEEIICESIPRHHPRFDDWSKQDSKQ